MKIDTLKPSYKEKIKKAAELLFNSKHAIALTGAGISIESGIPDFRGDDGIWDKYKPEIYGNIVGLGLYLSLTYILEIMVFNILCLKLYEKKIQ